MLMRRGNPFFDMWDEMSKFHRDVNQFFGKTKTRSDVGVYPSLNVHDDGESFVVSAEIPGIDPNDLEIESTADSLTIKGERKRPPRGEGESFHRREREWGTFSRSITLGTQVDPDKILAEYKLGVLRVVLPKAKEALPRKVNIVA